MKKIIITFSLLNVILNLNKKNNFYECFNGYYECLNSCCIEGKCVSVGFCNNEKINILIIYIITIIIFILIILLYLLFFYYIGKNNDIKKSKINKNKKYFNLRNLSESTLNNIITNNISENHNSNNSNKNNNFNNNFNDNINNILDKKDLKKNYINTVDIIEEVEESIYKTTIENVITKYSNNVNKNNNNNSMKIEYIRKKNYNNQKQNISIEINKLKRTNSF